MNINRDYLIINDVKKSNIKLDNGSMFFYITDKNTQNIFVNLVINISNNDLIQKYANIENAEDYTLTMIIVKPNNDYRVVEGKLHDKEKAIFEFNLKKDCCDVVGTYKCELLTKCNINEQEEITTSNSITYKVKKSILNDLDDIVEAPEYPVVIQLFDKLSDIEQYEEDRRANELARQLAEEQRQTRFNTLDADMVDRVNAMDSKMDDIEARISSKEQAVDKLIVDTKVDIDNYKVAKDQEIDDYKTAKDTEINEAITAQDSKIDTAINAQNDRITVVENNVVAQNDRLDTLENKDTLHESRLDAIETKNAEQDGRLDIAENRLANIGNDITNTMQPIIDEHTSRLDAIEAINVAQNTRLDAIEAKNQQQDDRLLDIEKVNNRQDIDIKCLYGASQTIDVTKEGNSIYLQNSNNGFAIVDEIQGNTLVNCNKEPDKEIILNGNINTQGYGNVTLTEGVDGGLVDVALEGNTMVNVCDQKDLIALPFEKDLTYLYANTQYALQFISDKATTADITLGGTQLLAQSIVVGLNRISITTPETLADNKLIINGVGANISEVVVTNTDREFGYFEGMKSVGECEDLEVVSCNKNLYNPNNNLIRYGYFNSDGTLTKDINYVYTEKYIDISGLRGKNLYVSVTKEGVLGDSFGYLRFILYDINKNVIYFYATGGSAEGECFIPEEAKYIRFSFAGSTKNLPYINVLLKEDGDRTYIPHQSNTQTLTHEPLRAVGDVKDRYVLIDGKWYIERNCLEKTINELYNLARTKQLNTYDTCNGIRIFTDNLGIKGSKNPQLYSDFKYANRTNVIGEAIAVTTPGTNTFIFHISKEINSEDKFLEVYGNGKCIFQLQTPTYEPIDYNPFEVYSDVTHISNNSTIPCNMVIKNTGYNCLLKPSTTYTVSSNLGLNTVTTPSTLTEDCLSFYDTDTSTVTTMKNVTILEGDYTTGKPIPSHFSGIESAFEQEYDEAVGKYKVKIRVQNEDATKENYIEFYINEPLRGIGDAKDKVYVKNDKVVVERNCGSVTFDGSDDENLNFNSTLDNSIRFDVPYPNISTSRDYTILCNRFKYATDNSMDSILNHTSLSLFVIFIDKAKLQTQDVSGFRQYLQQNPVTAVYQLAEPTYEEVEYNDVKLFIESFKNSTLFYNSNVPVTSTVHYSYSVPIVDTVAKTADVTDQQDQLIIDLATQCAVIEMMLM